MRTASTRIVPAALAASLLLGAGIGVSRAQPVIVERAMPAPIVEVVPPLPRAGLSWVPGTLGLARGRLVLGEGPLCRRGRSGHAGADRRSEASCTFSRTCLGARPLGLGGLAMELASGDLVPALSV
jgi:hypothetical protein